MQGQQSDRAASNQESADPALLRAFLMNLTNKN